MTESSNNALVEALQASTIYTHQQWRSPTRITGVGVAYLRLPIPLSPKAILWFAKSEYNKKKTSEGRDLGQWVDATGRHWFETLQQPLDRNRANLDGKRLLVDVEA